MDAKPTLSIEYCQGCNFRGRAVWLAQEVLMALERDLGAVTLIPGRNGDFIARLEGDVVFSNKEEGRLPEPRELKDAVRAKLGLPAVQRHE